MTRCVTHTSRPELNRVLKSIALSSKTLPKSGSCKQANERKKEKMDALAQSD